MINVSNCDFNKNAVEMKAYFSIFQGGYIPFEFLDVDVILHQRIQQDN